MVFAANGFRLPKGSLECSPNSSLHWSHNLLRFRFFGQMALASEKVLWRVPQTILESLHLSPSLLLGSKLRPLLTCLCITHTNPVRRKPSCRCCWGILWAYFFSRVGYLPYSVTRFEFEACFCFFICFNFKKMRTFTTWAVGSAALAVPAIVSHCEKNLTQIQRWHMARGFENKG